MHELPGTVLAVKKAQKWWADFCSSQTVVGLILDQSRDEAGAHYTPSLSGTGHALICPVSVTRRSPRHSGGAAQGRGVAGEWLFCSLQHHGLWCCRKPHRGWSSGRQCLGECVCVCVCVCACKRVSETESGCVCVCKSEWECLCICVCKRVRERESVSVRVCVHAHVCVCVYVW